MRPRNEIAGLNTDDTIAECMALVQLTRYSRFPLCEGGDLDKTLGVVHSKDIVALRHEVGTGRDLAKVARQMIFVPETARLEKLLSLFLKRKLHLALVVDEYGGTVGLATLENVLEELVGPIEDEFDQEDALVHRTGEGTWAVNGSLPTHKLVEIIGEPLPDSREACTVSGLITQHLGRFPVAGDVITLGSWELRVEATVGTRVARIEVTRLLQQQSDPPHEEFQNVA